MMQGLSMAVSGISVVIFLIMSIMAIPAVIIDMVQKKFYWTKRLLILIGVYLLFLVLSATIATFHGGT